MNIMKKRSDNNEFRIL
uniref:Uncharacterized protein n=1 Tax=Rhizophora mucronata TaxID=61149 RepID=A0A2P2NWY8_RHIMU